MARTSPIISSIVFVFPAFLVSFSLILCSPNKGSFALGGGETLASNDDYHIVQISSLLPSSVCTPSTKDYRKRGSLEVVHRNGPCSQFNKDQANAPTLAQILSQDQSRVNSIQRRLIFNSAENKLRGSRATLPDRSGRSIGSADYLVTVGLGTPKKKLSLIFDTGSSLTWTQCLPCRRCYQQQEPIYDPFASKSYRNITCKSPKCSLLSSATGTSGGCSTNTCVYGIQYGDNSLSVGFFGSETLSLTPSDIFPNFLFGCGKVNQGLFRGAAGLLGLGRDPVSIVYQTASKYGKYFSYCLPSPSSSSGTLTFGKGGTTSTNLKFTPSPVNPKEPSFYFIDIIGIKVGGKKLSIPKSVFKTAGTILDSGTVITRLQPVAYAALRRSFRQGTKDLPMTQGVSIFDTCYDVSNVDTVSVPTISFLFAGNIEVPMPFSGILYTLNTTQVCLAFASNGNATDVGIFGNVQQQTLDVVYDIAGGKIGFGTGGCS